MNDVIDEVIKFRAKPNVFLYAFEASRYCLVLCLGIAFAAMPLAYFRTGLPIGGLMLRIVFSVYAVMSVLFLIFVILFALCVEFILTNKRAIVRVAFVRASDNISIPLESIRTVEVRSYGARYGSIYFDCDEALLPNCLKLDDELVQISDRLRSAYLRPAVGRARGVASLIVKPGRAWLSMPSTLPALSGFYGFRQFEIFANLVLELQARA